eukprot:5401072-Amphidinium_carterae.1
MNAAVELLFLPVLLPEGDVPDALMGLSAAPPRGKKKSIAKTPAWDRPLNPFYHLGAFFLGF